jgi:acyl-CoA synthetase (AMP-forming)/AMP-acid ligase II
MQTILLFFVSVVDNLLRSFERPAPNREGAKARLGTLSSAPLLLWSSRCRNMRWGQRIIDLNAAARYEAGALDAWCRGSSLADYKRPREYVFVAEIPKSPVGKILRRLLVAGEYRRE